LCGCVPSCVCVCRRVYAVQLKHLPFYSSAKSAPHKFGRADEEYHAYKLEPQLAAAKDVLDFWRTNEDKYPRLASMAKQYLAVPASSAAVERLFSSVGLVKTDDRENLLDSTTIDIMWSKQNVP